MSAWLWLGGCALGLFILELAQRRLFPGDSALLAWLGRTRWREDSLGSDSERGVSSLRVISAEDLVPGFAGLAKRISREPTERAESRIRKRLSKAKTEAARAVLSCLLSEVELHKGDPEEAHALIQEAGQRLAQFWRDRDDRFQLAAEILLEFEALFHLRQGRCANVRQILWDGRSRFGQRAWMIEVEAQVLLLEGHTGRCRDLLGGSSTANVEGANAGVLDRKRLLLEAESYVLDRSPVALRQVLDRLNNETGLSLCERVALTRMQIESFLAAADFPGAWRRWGTLHRLAVSENGNRALKRVYHLACAQLQLVEGNTTEAHRQIQLALNDSTYPVARWEAGVVLGMILEVEGRFADAVVVWNGLREEAAGSRYHVVATAHLLELAEAPAVTEPSVVAAVP